MTMSPSICRFSFETSSTASPDRTVELAHTGSVRVEDTTYLGRLFSRCAHSSLRSFHREPNHSSLRLPSSSASVPSASLNSILAHSPRSSPPASPNQPPRSKPSCPSGSCTTPSSVKFVLHTSFPITVSLSLALFCSQRFRHRSDTKLGAAGPPSSAVSRCPYHDEDETNNRRA